MNELKKHFGKYDIVYLDPPWKYFGSITKDGAAGKHYDMMPDEEIYNMPIKELFRSKNGACFVWATGPKLPQAVKAIERWGLHYRNVAQVWVKTRKDGQIIGAQGPRATCVKQNAEYLLFATKNKKGKPLPLLNEKIRQVLEHKKGAHSEKPAIIRDIICELYGDVPKIELFCRHNPKGWTTWGNQVGKLKSVDET